MKVPRFRGAESVDERERRPVVRRRLGSLTFMSQANFMMRSIAADIRSHSLASTAS